MSKKDKTEEYKFMRIYEFSNIVSKFVIDLEEMEPYYFFDEEAFAESATRFNRTSLLHIFTVSILMGYHREEFHKNGDCYDEADYESWCDLFHSYKVRLKKCCYKNDDENFFEEWFEQNEDSFFRLFCALSDELVHVLFGNMSFIVRFNLLMSNIVKNYNKENETRKIPFPKDRMNEDGTIIRCSIPQWVRKIVYYRDYGHCVFCGKDLTGTNNHIEEVNYDHIIPLKQYGVNDPCNIQLSCEDCNKNKGKNVIFPHYKYQKLW